MDRIFFEVHCSEFKPDPICYLSQAFLLDFFDSLYPRKFRGIFYIFKKSIDKIKKACYTVISVYIQFTGEDYEYHFKQQFKRADLCAD